MLRCCNVHKPWRTVPRMTACSIFDIGFLLCKQKFISRKTNKLYIQVKYNSEGKTNLISKSNMYNRANNTVNWLNTWFRRRWTLTYLSTRPDDGPASFGNPCRVVGWSPYPECKKCINDVISATKVEKSTTWFLLSGWANDGLIDSCKLNTS